MNALLVLFGGQLTSEAFQPLHNGKNSVSLALGQSQSFPGVEKTVLFGASNANFQDFSGIQVEKRDSWTKRPLLEKLAELSAGFDLTYFAWLDCPFLDPVLAGAIAQRHIQYAAEYSYADGWPYGLAPEIISPQTAGILAKILSEDGPVTRDALFSVIQKDINAFDIETEISPVDFRQHRISLSSDSKRNFLLLERFIAAGKGTIPAAADVQRIISESPGVLRTLPNFFPIQVFSGCPQSCSLCPYPAASQAAGPVTGRRDYMKAGLFESLLNKIINFANDAVIDLSLWGEFSLHPEKMEIISMVLSRPELALVIETSGIGWKPEELEKSAELSRGAFTGRKSPLPPLSWIVSLDAADPGRYREIRGQGFSEAAGCAKKLFSLFPQNAYVQAVRTLNSEDDIEKFYRSWKEAAPFGDANIIIQKYDDFCGFLEKKQASDISPVIRQPCWHIMRDMPVLIDGTALLCREELGALKAGNAESGCAGCAGYAGKNNRVLGNVFSDTLAHIWEKGMPFYTEHCEKKYTGLCADCDEYYTYNF